MHFSSLKLIRLPEVISLTGYSRSSIYGLMSPSSPQFDPTFPRQVALSRGGKGAVAWVLTEIEAWIQARAQAR